MRVVHLISGYAPAFALGGPVESTRLLCSGLVQMGVDVKVLTTNEGQEPGQPPASLSGWQNFEEVPVRYCRKFLGWGASPEFLRELPSILRGSDVAHVTGTFSSVATAGMVACLRARVPFIASPRGSLEPWALSTKAWKKLPVLQVLKVLLNRAAAIHATSDLEAAGLARLGLKVPVFVVPNPVAPHCEDRECGTPWRELLNIGRDRPMLLMLGRIHPVKGIDIALDCLTGLVAAGLDPVLVLAGPDGGPYERGIEARVKVEGLQSRVRRVPLVTGAAKQRLLSEADLLLLPSRQENFGNVVVEALLAGTPVVASQSTPWQVLEEEKCGTWVPLNPASMVEAIQTLLSGRDRLAAMACRARAFAQRRYSRDTVVRSMIGLYEGSSRRRARGAFRMGGQPQ